MDCGVYKIMNTINEKVYIGSSKDTIIYRIKTNKQGYVLIGGNYARSRQNRGRI